jgi:anti-sigma regulatory factor (Ser/Thr protein kinase)
MTVLTPLDFPGDASAAEIMSWRREYLAQAGQARELRRFVGCLLDGFPRLDDVVSVVVEMFDNAIQHSDSRLPGGRVTLEIRRWPGCCVTVAVADQGGPGAPCRQRFTDDLEHGRGLTILSALTTRWGWHGDTRGRTVTALFLD